MTVNNIYLVNCETEVFFECALMACAKRAFHTLSLEIWRQRFSVKIDLFHNFFVVFLITSIMQAFLKSGKLGECSGKSASVGPKSSGKKNKPVPWVEK